MPQYPSPRLGRNFETLVSSGGALSALNIITPTALTNPNGRVGRLCRVVVTTAGSTPGAAYDAASTGAVAAANQVMTIPNAVGIIAADWPCANGIVIAPDSGQTVAVSFL